jgi:hypothetical protein
MIRIEKRELSEVPSFWSKRERGHHLWRLLQDKGIDPSRLYTIDYFPHRQCWLLTQGHDPGLRPRCAGKLPTGAAAESFYVEATAELRRTARAGFATVAARSTHFARFGCKYELPPKPQETTPADLVQQLGGSLEDGEDIRFDTEGGWHAQPVEERKRLGG